MLRDITEREEYLIYQFRNADTDRKNLVAYSLRIPLTEQETREAIELYLSRVNVKTNPIEREIIETGIAQHNDDCAELFRLFVQDQAEAQ